jgi:hypothetical protein
MPSAQIAALIAENAVALAKAKVERNEQVEILDKQIAALEKKDYDLNIRLQLAEADEAFYTAEHKEGTKLKWVSSTKTFYENEAAWLTSLPAWGAGTFGSVKVTEPTISDRKLKRLSCTPLSGTNDALKLKELHARFPGGTIVFNTGKEFLEIEHLYQDIATYPEDWCHLIHSKEQGRSVYNFLDLSDPPPLNGKPQIMAEWNGLYIDLSHLF